MGGGGWEDELKNKTNLSQSLVEVEAELGKNIMNYEPTRYHGILAYRIYTSIIPRHTSIGDR